MTITYPRAFPLHRFETVVLAPYRRQTAGASEGGSDFVIDRGVPAWRGQWRTDPLSAAEYRRWSAWGASLEGRAKTFLGYDPMRWIPAAHQRPDSPRYPLGFAPNMLRADGSSFDGTANLSAIATGRRTATFDDLPAGFVLTEGDQFGIIEAGLYSLHEVTEGATTHDLSSGAITVSFQPELPSVVTTAAVVNFHRPCARFRLIGGGVAMEPNGRPRRAWAWGSDTRVGTCSFEAVSTLR